MTAASPGPVKLKSASLAARFSTIRLPLTSFDHAHARFAVESDARLLRGK